MSSKDQCVNAVIKEFPDVFRERLGTIKTVQAHREIKTGSRPRLLKTHFVPFALSL